MRTARGATFVEALVAFGVAALLIGFATQAFRLLGGRAVEGTRESMRLRETTILLDRLRRILSVAHEIRPEADGVRVFYRARVDGAFVDREVWLSQLEDGRVSLTGPGEPPRVYDVDVTDATISVPEPGVTTLSLGDFEVRARSVARGPDPPPALVPPRVISRPRRTPPVPPTPPPTLPPLPTRGTRSVRPQTLTTVPFEDSQDPVSGALILGGVDEEIEIAAAQARRLGQVLLALPRLVAPPPSTARAIQISLESAGISPVYSTATARLLNTWEVELSRGNRRGAAAAISLLTAFCRPCRLPQLAAASPMAAALSELEADRERRQPPRRVPNRGERGPVGNEPPLPPEALDPAAPGAIAAIAVGMLDAIGDGDAPVYPPFARSLEAAAPGFAPAAFEAPTRPSLEDPELVCGHPDLGNPECFRPPPAGP